MRNDTGKCDDGMLKLNNEFLNEIKENHKLDVKLVDLLPLGHTSADSDFKVDEYGFEVEYVCLTILY